MPSRTLVAMIVAACTLMLPCTLEAQQQQTFSLEATVGKGQGHTAGEYKDDRRGVAVDVLLALRLRPAGSGTLVAGLNAGGQGPFATEDICLESSIGGCIPTFPAFGTIGALVGWENSSATLRAMGGPAYVHGDGAGTVATQGRLEGGMPVARHLALIASARAIMIPNYRGDAFSLFAFGLGIRIR